MTTPSRAIDTDELLAQMGWVQSLARSLVYDDGLAADVAQQTWLQALTRPPRATAGPGLRAWLATVTRTFARQHARSERRRTTRQQIASRPEAVDATVDVVERGAAQSRVVEVVMALDEPYRSTLLLRYLDELSFVEIAEQQSVSEAAVRKRVSRGLTSVRDRLDADERDWSCALLALAGPAKAGLGLAALTTGGILMAQRWAILGVAFVIGSLSVWFFGFDTEPVETTAPPLTEVVSTLPVERGPEKPVGRELVSSGFSVEVFTAGGAPVRDALVILLADNELVAQETTTVTGSVVFSLFDRPIEMLVARRGAVPERFVIQEDTTRVVLADKSEVSGRVFYGEQEMSGTMPLELLADRVWPVFEGLSESVLSRLGGLGLASNSMRIDVSESFVFAGIGIDWTGRIAISEEYVFVRLPRLVAEDANHVYLPAPRRNIDLHVTRLPVVEGRLVRADTGAPIVDARLTAKAEFGGGPRSMVGLVSTDRDGKFRLALSLGNDRVTELDWANANLKRFVLRAQRKGGGAEIDLGVSVKVLAVYTDLGEIRVDLAPPVSFRVEDEAGKPIPDAFASTGKARSTHTDATGRAEFRASPGEGVEVTVVARGYANTKAQLHASDTLVVLKRAATLDVKILGVTAAIARELRLHVKQPGLLFFSGVSFVKQPDEKGEVSLTGLPTDKRTSLTVRDRYGTVLGQQTVEPLRGTEPRVIEIELTTKLYSLVGFVSDARGRPLPRVLVNILLDREGDMTRSDVDGRFSFDGLSLKGKKAVLVVERRGYMAEYLKDIDLHEGMEPVRVTLKKGRIITLTARYADGRPVVGVRAMGLLDGRGAIALTGVDGRADLKGLPFASGQVGVEIGGHKIQVEVTADQFEAEVVVPVLGRAVVHAEVHRQVSQTCRTTISLVGHPEQQSYLFLRRGKGKRSGDRSFSLLPGEYRAVVETWDQPKEKEALGYPYIFTVKPDETTEVRIDIR